MDKLKKVGTKLKEFIKTKIFCVLILFFAAIALTVIALYFSVGELGHEMFVSYFANKWIFFLNFLPIFCVLLFFYFLFNRTSMSLLITTAITYIIVFINVFKMQLRDDNLFMEDVTLIKEALKIKTNYTIEFSKEMIVSIIGVILVAILLYILIDRRMEKKQRSITRIVLSKLSTVVAFVGVMMLLLEFVYTNNYLYEKTTNELGYYNVWSPVNTYISRGTIYSFLHSYANLKDVPPDGYNEREAKKKLISYEYSNINNSKKVNVIGIMLEAYNDFSRFDEIEFAVDPYKKLHEIEAESYYGELATNIFAGGTVDTERKFLTGYYDLPTFRKKTNSYVRYFVEQGYKVEGSHPCYEWFYNRNTINENLGFENYYFYEDKYSALANGALASDSILMEEILSLYNANKGSDKPYFSFNVTYQNHGPYPSTANSNIEYVVRKDYYTNEEYNILNNYLDGIRDTSEQLYNMIEELRNDEQPVVLIFFGDHNPWLGNSNSVYEMLGINFDFNSEEGALNYYATPYVIWANDAAKEVLENDFIGEGETISPNYLMNEFFELAGYGGNEYMKFTNEVKEKISVINDNFYYENGKFTNELSKESKKLLNEFHKVEYYWKRNFKN